MRSLSIILSFVMLASMTLGVGCRKEKPRQRQRPRPVVEPAAKAPKAPDLPRLVKPKPAAAAKIVDILYTTNVSGDADPCG